MKQYEELLRTIANVQPDIAECLSDSAKLIQNKLNESLELFKNDLSKAAKGNDFSTVGRYSSYCSLLIELINSIKKETDDYISILEKHKSNIGKKVTPNTAKTPKVTNKFYMDSSTPHYLNEDFEHKKPCSFLFENHVQEVDSWGDMIVKAASFLAKSNKEKLNTLIDKPQYLGKKIHYLGKKIVYSKTEEGRAFNRQIPGTDVYIWINLNANQVRDLIIKLLKDFDYSEKEFVIFLKADYSSSYK